MVGRDRYMRWLTLQIQAILQAGFDESVAYLTGEFSDITPFQKARRAQLIKSIEERLVEAYDDANVFHAGQMRKYASLESRVSVNEIKNLIDIGGGEAPGLSFAVLSPQRVKAIAELPISGLSLGDWWEEGVNRMSTKVRQQIQLGLLQGEDARQIVRRIVPTPGSPMPTLYKQGVNSATTLVRTTLTHVENTANIETMKSMGAEVTDSYKYTATRDERTSLICLALDGKIFKYSDPQKKVPPQHPNCRSTTIPIVNYKALGIDVPPDSYKMSDMSRWLKGADDETQAALLGASRAAMFRAGTLTLADLVSADNRAFTLDELRDFAK